MKIIAVAVVIMETKVVAVMKLTLMNKAKHQLVMKIKKKMTISKGTLYLHCGGTSLRKLERIIKHPSSARLPILILL